MSRVPAPGARRKVRRRIAAISGDPRMTDAAGSDLPPKSRRWKLYAPFLALLGFACLWTAFWFWAQGRAGEAVDVWLKREADRGRVYACGSRSVGGYPFRIEIDCENPTARVPADGGEASLAAPRFLAVAQVWDPKRLIGELTGPVTIWGADGTKADLSFSLAQASARIDGRRVERASLVMKTPRLVVGETEIGAAAAFEGHLRRTLGGGEGAYDLAAAVEGAVIPLLDGLPLGNGPVAIELQAQGTGLGPLGPRPMSDRLRAFAGNGGRINLALLRVSRGDIAAQAKGEFGLDVEGRANGGLDVTARGLDGVVRGLAGGGEEKGGMMSQLLGMGVKALGKSAELDGKPATRYRLTLDKGRLSLGPIRLTRLPPAF